MAVRGRHRRHQPSRINRASLTVTAGGAGVALPLIGAGTVHAASLDVWEKVASCESTSHWHINTGNGYFGGLQFTQSTWERYGGTHYAPRADLASKDQQIAIAERVLKGQGPGAWPACGPRAGLARGGDAPDISPIHSGGNKSGGTKSGGNTSGAGKPGGSGSGGNAVTTTSLGQRALTERPARNVGPTDVPTIREMYTVASGDSLSKIASEERVRGGWQGLYEGNRSVVGDDPDFILPGQRLTLRIDAPKKPAGAPHTPPPARVTPPKAATTSPAPPAPPAKMPKSVSVPGAATAKTPRNVAVPGAAAGKAPQTTARATPRPAPKPVVPKALPVAAHAQVTPTAKPTAEATTGTKTKPHVQPATAPRTKPAASVQPATAPRTKPAASVQPATAPKTKPATKPVPRQTPRPRPAEAEKDRYAAPVSAGTGTRYGKAGSSWASGYHTGVDFPVPTGTSVKAVAEGRVVSAGWGGAYGYQIVLRHDDGRYSQYAHLSALSVREGQRVTAGQRIGRSGSTGNSSGPHLHFEVRTGPGYGSDIDPLAYLRARGVSL
ncbi:MULTISPECIES: peptidoglycan DD-metalloendopeptidase family protein [unclassified Streptomyces]|uniref:peptidoglycan DD-metalloendopeptidase family protein n=1 Tax=unclassified Streptomyces TaxID=2593676 RepID=UPI00166124FD|nr:MULTISPECIES: transglycosylase family protein [unclassified Streptomyces]MBD0708214.1 peptidase [Streptomyces sp. CBMA291]MBD0717783.1 peptidase [Streptomyces sp. CBMA370]